MKLNKAEIFDQGRGHYMVYTEDPALHRRMANFNAGSSAIYSRGKSTVGWHHILSSKQLQKLLREQSGEIAKANSVRSLSQDAAESDSKPVNERGYLQEPQDEAA